MNANIDTISLIFLFLTSFFVIGRRIAQLRELRTQQILIIVHSVIVLGIALAEVLLLTDKINLKVFEVLYRSSITTLFSIVLTLISLILLSKFEPKKIRTLWRIPLIGFFSGMYFELKYTPLLCSGYFVLCFVVLFGQRIKYRYLLSKLIMLTPALVGIFYINMNSVAYLNIMLIWFMFTSSFILDAANINSKFKIED